MARSGPGRRRAREFGDGVGDAGVLPDDGVADGLAGVAVPDHGGFALVGDADGGEIAGAEVLGLHRFADDLLRAAPDLGGIVLDPAGPGINLRVLPLRGGDDVARSGRRR